MNRQDIYFNSIADLRYANQSRGDHFFERSTMRFFDSKVESSLYAGRYFITSEKTGFDSLRRRYTIREASPDGSIKTSADDAFNKYRTIDDAREAARDLVRILKSTLTI